MIDLKTLQNQYRERIYNSAHKHRVNSVHIFGSVARGDATRQSDLDLLITVADDCSLLDMAGFKIDVEEMLGCKVDVVEREGLKPRFWHLIESEVVPL